MPASIETGSEIIDLEELRNAARKLLERTVERRQPYTGGQSETASALIDAMVELGWTMLTVPVSCGGLGQSFTALAPIYEEMGRALSPVSLAGTMAAVDVLSRAAPESEITELIAGIATGKVRFALIFADRAWADLTRASLFKTLNGNWDDVSDAVGATHLLILSAEAEAPLICVDLLADGVALTSNPLWDRTRHLAAVHLRDVRGHVVAAVEQSSVLASLARAHLDLAVALDSLGGAQQALAEAIDYMGARRQFDRPVGSFQALKHRAADLKVGLEIARALTSDACDGFATLREGWEVSSAKAKLLAADSFRAIAEDCVQFHGGIGFTWELDSHLFLKRALLNEMLGGSPEQYRDRIAPEVMQRALAGRKVT